MYDTIQRGTFSGLSMHILSTNSINFYIKSVCRYVFLINKISILTNLMYVWLIITAFITNLSKQILPTSSIFSRIINTNLMILSIKRLLYKRLFQFISIYYQIILILLQFSWNKRFGIFFKYIFNLCNWNTIALVLFS